MGQGGWLQARSNAGGAALPCWVPGRSARVAPASTTAQLHRRAVEAPRLGWAWSHHWPLPTFGCLFAAPWVQPPVPRPYCAGVVALAMASVWASSLVCDQCGSDSSRDGVRLGGPAASPASSCAAGSRVSIREVPKELLRYETGMKDARQKQNIVYFQTWQEHSLDALFEDECHQNKTEHALTVIWFLFPSTMK
ncbi:hypothetical protein EJB05_17972 [Eragrostis curvula]|uniref:Uncharacterized protein n=1 Tax=Eragrostis curvula TaxID=38414 RepID=A0A5J9VLZ5_9POAL|nr:hypothetical protein EJB05_17972 [Eragrostis curvula]